MGEFTERQTLQPWPLVSCARRSEGSLMSEIDAIISHLRLEPLQPEGGYFRRTWTSPTGSDDHPASTAIYFLLTAATFSAFHRLKADEIWHFYAGDPVEHWQLHPKIPFRRVLSSRIFVSEDEAPQLGVPAYTWQAARLSPIPGDSPRGWALLGCTLSPGWRDDDFELGVRTDLFQKFPGAAPLIMALTR